MRGLQKIISDVELYKAHAADPENVVLPEDVRKRIERYDSACDLIRKYGVESKIAKKIHREKYQIDITTARKDFYIAVQISGQTSIYNKDFCRYFAIMQAERLLIRAIKTDDLKEANSALRNYIEASGIKIEDPDMPDFSDLRIPEAVIRAHPELLNLKPDPELEKTIKRFLTPKKNDDEYYEDAKIITNDHKS